jgi:ABC-2 type transport system permease protein
VGEVRGYLILAAATIRAQIESRTLFVTGAVASGLSVGLETLGIYLVARHFGQIGGWSPEQVVVLNCLLSLGYGLFSVVGSYVSTDTFAGVLRNGDLQRGLSVPVGALTWLLASGVQPRQLCRCAVAGAVLVLASTRAHVEWTAGTVGVVALSVCATATMFFSLNLAATVVTFRTRQASELATVLTVGGATMSGYPIHIFDSILRLIFVYVVPIGLTVYVPTLWLLRLPGVAGIDRSMLPLTWIAPLLALGLATVCWRAGLRRYLEES